jgi:hypothetical protein
VFKFKLYIYICIVILRRCLSTDSILSYVSVCSGSYLLFLTDQNFNKM